MQLISSDKLSSKVCFSCNAVLMRISSTRDVFIQKQKTLINLIEKVSGRSFGSDSPDVKSQLLKPQLNLKGEEDDNSFPDSRSSEKKYEPNVSHQTFCNTKNVIQDYSDSDDEVVFVSEFRLKKKIAWQNTIRQGTTTIGTTSKRIDCYSCEPESFEKIEIKKRQRTHTSEEACICEVCGKSLASAFGLDQHLKTVHATKKRFPCPLCPRSFHKSSVFRRHDRNVHQGLRDYPCDICNESFCNLQAVKMHKKSYHSSEVLEKIFECKICEKNFALKCNLRKHIQAVHDEPTFECSKCPMKFTRRLYLLDHQEKHETLEFACDHCTRSFRNKGPLNQHLKKVHIKIKETFSCEPCGLTFRCKRKARDHNLRQHTAKIS